MEVTRLERVLRINPKADFRKIHEIITRDICRNYSDLSFNTLCECRNLSWMVINHYEYILAILCARLITYDDIDINVTFKRHPEYLYKIEVLDSFLDPDDIDFQYDDIKKINEYHILFMILKEAIKELGDMSIVFKVSTAFCTGCMQNALKNNRFKLLKMDEEYMEFIRY
jgi:hypothetical protein